MWRRSHCDNRGVYLVDGEAEAKAAKAKAEGGDADAGDESDKTGIDENLWQSCAIYLFSLHWPDKLP